MRIGVPAETRPGETRVAATPETVKKLAAKNEVRVQAGAGVAASIRDQDYEAAGAKILHLDFMDGHFVPNISFGLPVVEAVRRISRLPLDVHLMIDNPGDYLERFRKAGADTMTVHIEAVADPRPMLDRIRGLGAAAGLALNPQTPLAAIDAALPHCDIVLVMSVMPGFGGQEFESVALGKLQSLRSRADCDALLEVDGGVTLDTAAACGRAGADLLVAGTAVFRAGDYGTAIRQLSSLASAARFGV